MPETDDIFGRYHGSHTRRVDRYIVGVVIAVILFKPVSTGAIFQSSGLIALAILAVIVLASEWWFVRRRGIEVTADGLTLHYFYGRRRVPWERIEGFRWSTRLLERGEYLTATLDNGATVLLPTLGRATNRGSGLGAFFGSSRMLSRTGSEVDALDALESALAAARSKEEQTA